MARLARLPGFDRPPDVEDARIPRLRTRYYAFLSYSHKDKELADWLHRELEKFRVPHSLAGKLTANGVVPRRLTPIFRDQQDLSAGADLGEEIKAALAASQFLVVLCSPEAAKSRWTNAEIENFKRTRPEGCVLAAVVAGEPFASDIPGREAEECFPPALRYRYDRRGHQTTKRAEPLAADFRDSGEGKRRAFLKLVAGMLGVGLDDLVQRENVRRHRQMAWLAAGSLAGMAVTSTLAITAIQSRNEAREQRREAEGLVGFMLGDLKDKLEPIGRLDALDAVGSRALAYYQNQDKGQLSDESLVQRSRALTLMGEIAQKRGDLDGALRRYREAMASTAEALRRDPNNGDRVFDHAQNMFWVGFVADQRRLRPQAEAAFREYKRLADQLVIIDPDNKAWRLEPIYAETNLGAILIEEARYREAAEAFQRSLPRIESLAAGEPANRAYQDQLGETLAYLSQARESQGSLDEALGHRERQLALLDQQAARGGADAALKRKMLAAHRALGRLFAERGDLGQGLAHLGTSAKLADDLATTEPANAEWSEKRAATYLDLGELQLTAGRIDVAGTSARLACDLANRLAERDASVVAWSVTLRADCLGLRAHLALAQGSNVEAGAISSQAVALRRAEAVRDGSADNRMRLGEALLLRGEAARAAGDGAMAQQAWRSADAVWPKDVQLTPPYLVSRALILRGVGRTAEASTLISRLQTMGYRHPALAKQLRLVAQE
jgi:tetratricopeptide (TPR) repeat protein